MVDDGGPVGLDGVQLAFDDERVVSDAGIMLAATRAERLQIEDLVDDWVRLGVRGAASRAGRKVMTYELARQAARLAPDRHRPHRRDDDAHRP